MIFEDGPRGGRTRPWDPASARADQGGGLLKKKTDIQSDSKSRKAKLGARSHHTRKARWWIHIYINIYMHVYMYVDMDGEMVE